MAKQHLLSKEENNSVEYKYHSNPLYKALRKIAMSWDSKARTLSLRPLELFYHTIRSIDDMRSTDDTIAFCQVLGDELKYHFLEQYDLMEDDVNIMVSLIVASVDHCLFLMDSFMFQKEIISLKEWNVNNNPIGANVLTSFSSLIIDKNASSISTWLIDYYRGNDCLSNEIELIVYGKREHIVKQKEMKEQGIVKDLCPFFINNNDYVSDFLRRIMGHDGKQVTDVINLFITDNKMPKNFNKSKLHEILNKHGYYSKSNVVFTKQINSDK